MSTSDVPAASAGASPKNSRNTGTRMKPPPSPTIDPNALENNASAKSASEACTTLLPFQAFHVVRGDRPALSFHRHGIEGFDLDDVAALGVGRLADDDLARF